jgi:hypothetical protein
MGKTHTNPQPSTQLLESHRASPQPFSMAANHYPTTTTSTSMALSDLLEPWYQPALTLSMDA